VPEVSISAEPRLEFGKGAARRVRRGHKVPAVLYGHGTPPRHVSLPGHELMRALKSANVLLRLEGLEGGAELALPKAVQRDAVSGAVEHVDLILVRRGEQVTIEVPIIVTGALIPDGFLDQQLVSLSVSAEATHIPQSIEVSIQDLPIGQTIHAGQVKLPEGSTLQTDPEAVVVHITGAQSVAQFESELAEAESELAPAAPVVVPDEAAPAEPAEGESSDSGTE
jgi:large subunit ribosomal protein L25